MMQKLMRRKLAMLLTLGLLACLLMLAGCGQENGQGTQGNSGAAVTQESGAQPGQPSASPAEAKELSIKVYYPNEAATKLVAATRQIKATEQDKYQEALKALLQGPQEKGQAAIIPKRAKLLAIEVKDGTARVSFSKELKDDFVGGSTGEAMLVGSVVNTLTEFPEVKRVQILVEGQPIETLAGHFDLSEPLERQQDLL